MDAHSTALTDAYRDRKSDRRTELVDAYDEITALRAQLADIARHDAWVARNLELVKWADRRDRLQGVIDFLKYRSKRLTAQGGN
jgi:hypothetical protein